MIQLNNFMKYSAERFTSHRKLIISKSLILNRNHVNVFPKIIRSNPFLFTARCLSQQQASADALKKKIMDDLKAAMKGSNKDTVNVLKSILSDLTYIQKSNTKTSLVSVIQKAMKKRSDAMEQFKSGGRSDLAEKELVELQILEKYLPDKIDAEKLKILVEKIVKETGAASIKDMGKVMKALEALVPEGAAPKSSIVDVIKNFIVKK